MPMACHVINTTCPVGITQLRTKGHTTFLSILGGWVHFLSSPLSSYGHGKLISDFQTNGRPAISLQMTKEVYIPQDFLQC
jgi:hypothetical protein